MTTNNFHVSIVDLPRQVGSMKEFDVTAPAPNDMGTAVIGARPGSPIEAHGTLTSVEDGVLASGSATIDVHGECVRCLGDVDQTQTVSFNELYVFPTAAIKHAEDGDDEARDLFEVGENSLDLEPAIRDALVLRLPFKPLCDDNCEGLCSECGERFADLPDDHVHEVIDPRWASLGTLLNQAQADADGQAGSGQDGGK
nr:DUF177 domain-containing protein [Actinomyces vulturis]